MNRALRRVLHQLNVSVTKFDRTSEARRPRIMKATGVNVILDVGANEGQYATLLRDAGYPGHMISYEPVRAPFDSLSARAAEDPRWEAHRFAVGATTGEVTMNVSDNSVHSSTLQVRDSYARVDPHAAYVRTEVAPCETLDRLAQEHVAENATLAVKIDVQGMESDVLDGAPETMTRTRVLEIEFLNTPAYEGETLAPELLARVFALGFELALTQNLMMDPESGRSIAFNGLFVRP